MAMRRCDADEHHYDDSKHSTCPYCRKTVVFTPEDDEDDHFEPAPAYRPVATQVFGIEKEEIPVVGWLVVKQSPASRSGKDNKGRDMRLVAGMNRVGRDPDMEISMDFGDNKIGRSSHCVVTYDPESNSFFLQGGEGKNLTYVLRGAAEDGSDPGGWDVVLQPRKLEQLDQIKIGDSVLLFMPLCSEYFMWDFSE